jgi:hypothetical protein
MLPPRCALSSRLRLLREADGGGWVSDHIRSCLAALMRRLRYERYVSQGGDCGWAISNRMALQNVPVLIGIHINMPGPSQWRLNPSSRLAGRPKHSDREERTAFHALDSFYAPAMRHDGVRRNHQPAGRQQLHKNPASPRLREIRS